MAVLDVAIQTALRRHRLDGLIKSGRVDVHTTLSLRAVPAKRGRGFHERAGSPHSRCHPIVVILGLVPRIHPAARHVTALVDRCPLRNGSSGRARG